MGYRQWYAVHQGWVQGGMFLGIVVGVLVRYFIGGNVWVQSGVGFATMCLSPVITWFFASDGRRATVTRDTSTPRSGEER